MTEDEEIKYLLQEKKLFRTNRNIAIHASFIWPMSIYLYLL